MKRGLAVFPPVQVGLLRMALAGTVLVPVAGVYLYRLRKQQVRIPYSALAISALSGNVIPAFLFGIGLSHMDSALGGVLNSTSALWAFVLGVLFFGLAFRWQKAAGVLLGLVGVAVLLLLAPSRSGTAPAAAVMEGDQLWVYGLLIMLATVLYGFSVNWLKARLSHLPPLAVVSIGLLLMGVWLWLPLLMVTDFWHRLTTTPGAWQAFGYLVLLGVVGTALTVGVFYELVRRAGMLQAASVTYMIPLVALGWGVLDGETLTWAQAAGMGLILMGLWLMNRARYKKVNNIHKL
jgi:drug/metabolite transporter (DMT)-like permease